MSDNTNTQDDDLDVEMVEITYEDGTVCNCQIVAKFEVEDKTYAALLPTDEEDPEIIVYRYVEKGGDDIDLLEINDQDEFNMVADIMDEILDDLEFNSED